MENTYIIAAFHQNTPCVEILTSGVAGAELTTAERPLSLISLSARQAVDAADLRGLCYQRFQADITLDCAVMPPKGTTLACGELVLLILPEGKTCWPECILVQEGLPCPLIDGVRFASVTRPGTLCQGDVLSTPARV
jgi:hypothetical protein